MKKDTEEFILRVETKVSGTVSSPSWGRTGRGGQWPSQDGVRATTIGSIDVCGIMGSALNESGADPRKASTWFLCETILFCHTWGVEAVLAKSRLCWTYKYWLPDFKFLWYKWILDSLTSFFFSMMQLENLFLKIACVDWHVLPSSSLSPSAWPYPSTQ